MHDCCWTESHTVASRATVVIAHTVENTKKKYFKEKQIHFQGRIFLLVPTPLPPLYFFNRFAKKIVRFKGFAGMGREFASHLAWYLNQPSGNGNNADFVQSIV